MLSSIMVEFIYTYTSKKKVYIVKCACLVACPVVGWLSSEQLLYGLYGHQSSYKHIHMHVYGILEFITKPTFQK